MEVQERQDRRVTPQDYYDSWKASFPLFAEEVLRINVTEHRKQVLGIGEDVVPLRLNDAQQLLLAAVQDTTGGTPPRVLVLKSRQVGSSTFCVLYFVWRCLFWPGTRVAVVAQGERTAKTILKMVAFAMRHIPGWLMTHPDFPCRTGANSVQWESGSVIESGTANSEFWRGGSYDGAVLTEATSYDNLATTMAAVMPAVHGPAFIESTAKGLGLFKEMWDDPNVAFRKVFISWLIDPAARKATGERKPTAEDEAYIRTHGLTPEQVNWYLEAKWTTYAGNQRLFDQENPATAELAFIVAGSRFFAGRHFQVDPRMIPADPRHDWEKPVAGHLYAMGIDVASGAIDGDASVAIVLDVTDPKRITVASTMQCWLPEPLFAEECIRLARDYGGQLLACVEANVGLVVIRALRKAGIRQYVRQRDSKMIDQMDEYGFYTTAQSRPLLMSNLTRYVMGNVLSDLRDPRLMSECNTFLYNEQGKPEAAPGKHDDMVLALALALECMMQYGNIRAPAPPPRIPPRPVHDLNAMILHDKKYGVQRAGKSPY